MKNGGPDTFKDHQTERGIAYLDTLDSETQCLSHFHAEYMRTYTESKCIWAILWKVSLNRQFFKLSLLQYFYFIDAM